MEKTKINAKDVLDSIHSGLSDEQLMSQHNLSPHQLRSLFKKLVQAGFMAQADVDKRGAIELPEEASWTCPACGEPQEKEFDKCPECGADVAAFKARQVIGSWQPSEGLTPLLKDLQSAGALKEETAPVEAADAPAAIRPERVLECPACGKSQPEPFDECPVCGIVVARYLEQQKQRGPETEVKVRPVEATEPRKTAETPVLKSVPGTPPTGVVEVSGIMERLSPEGSSVSALQGAGAGIAAKLSDLLGGSGDRRGGPARPPSEVSSATELRTVGKFFTYLGLAMAAVGVAGGLIQLLLGYGGFSFLILGYAILLIVIGGPIWLICRGVADAIEVSEEISRKLEDNKALLTLLLKKIEREGGKCK